MTLVIYHFCRAGRAATSFIGLYFPRQYRQAAIQGPISSFSSTQFRYTDDFIKDIFDYWYSFSICFSEILAAESY